ncbi:hypothetical protein [Pseudomonas citronellolis]|jgi:hypothetical protein|uniref:hypothetical protein n=1 Tax=Pseudomonas citronellolis TaxID=53408 RepID=UPI003C2AFC53
MSRAANVRRTSQQIAREAIEQLQIDHQQSSWMGALMTAIHTELDRGPGLLECRISRVKHLADLGRYLADTMADFTDSQAEELQRQLDDTEARE